MKTTSSGGLRSSAGCRFSAGISLYSAHTGTIEGPLVYSIRNSGSIKHPYLIEYLNRPCLVVFCNSKVDEWRWGRPFALGYSYISRSEAELGFGCPPPPSPLLQPPSPLTHSPPPSLLLGCTYDRCLIPLRLCNCQKLRFESIQPSYATFTSSTQNRDMGWRVPFPLPLCCIYRLRSPIPAPKWCGRHHQE